MTGNTDLIRWLAIWVVVFLLIVFIRFRRKVAGSGLVFAYLFNLWAIHWLGAFVYALPWYDYRWNKLWYRSFDVDWVINGFKLSTYGFLAFAAGSLFLTPLLQFAFKRRQKPKAERLPDPRLPQAYIFTGLIIYFVLPIFIGQIPGITALTSSGLNLTIIGIGLVLWKAWKEGKRTVFYGAMAFTSICLPLASVITQGFLSYGAAAVVTLLAFVGGFFRPRWKLVVLAMLVAYLGMSFYTTYMRDRPLLRSVVWGEESFLKRIQQVYLSMSTLEWLDLHNQKHLRQIDSRLNQNLLVGAAVEKLSVSQEYAHGETLAEALFALIPRALWPAKPMTAGSGNLVTRFTDIKFSVGTSVGIGQVMEFYVNFGNGGVWLGFLCLGVLITILDSMARERLLRGDWQGFSFWILTGLSFLMVGGSFVEVTASAGGAALMAVITNTFLEKFRGRRFALRQKIEGNRP